MPGPVAQGINNQVGSLQKGTELHGIYSPQSRDDLMAEVISEDWPVWLSVLPALGIKKAVSWGTQQCINWNTYFAGEMPGMHFVSSKEKVIKRKKKAKEENKKEESVGRVRWVKEKGRSAFSDGSLGSDAEHSCS